MAQITTEDHQKCYRLGADVFEGKISFDAAVAQAEHDGMNSASASDYIRNVRYMLEGFPYKRTINAAATEYYLDRIAESFGPEVLAKAVQALNGHIDYYESIQSVTLHKQREISASFQSVLDGKGTSGTDGDLFEKLDYERAFQSEIKRSANSDPAVRQARLKAASSEPKTVLVRAKLYRRNPDVVAERLYRASGVCEGCLKPAAFSRPDDTPYLEVHHRIPLGEGGLDTLENTMALCPNCHREEHFGKYAMKYRK